MYGQPCKYDCGNYDHHCVYIGRGCDYIDRIDRCPILIAEKKEQESSKLRQR
ncbi:MAG: hypothetical protein ABH829_03265 [archaeon]